MKTLTTKRCPGSSVASPVSEILILADAKIFAHNLTPEMARALSKLNPADKRMRQRAKTGNRADLTLKICKQP
jgi:hypothetical protein